MLFNYLVDTLKEKYETLPNPSKSSKRPVSVHATILLLQLLKQLVFRPSATFTSSPQFVRTIKQQLIGALLQSCLSQNRPIFIISIEIFTCLIDCFKMFLKREILIFFTNIVFNLLNSNHSSQLQKDKSLNVRKTRLFRRYSITFC